MKKIMCMLLCITSLTSCNNSISSSSSLSSSSSISSEVSASFNEDDLTIDNINDYLKVAVTDLLLVNNNCDIEFKFDDKIYNSNFYFDIKTNKYQLTYGDFLLTYLDSKLYLDNKYNHFYLDSFNFEGATLLSSVLIIDKINFDFFEIKKELKKIITSLKFKEYEFNVTIKDSKLSSIEKIEIKKGENYILITPSLTINKYIDISMNNHIYLKESFEFIKDYIKYITLYEELEILVNMEKDNISLSGNFNYYINNINGSLLLNINDIEYDISYNNELTLNNESISLGDLISIIINSLLDNDPFNYLDYLYNLVNSQIIINDNLISFENETFKEEISFTLNELIIINFSNLNLSIEIRGVTM